MIIPSLGVCISLSGADVGGDGAPSPVGGATGLPFVFIDSTCARTRDPVGSGAAIVLADLRSGTRADVSGAIIDRADISGAVARDVSGADAVALACVDVPALTLACASPANAVGRIRCSSVAKSPVFLVNFLLMFF